jgi:hypothetical protein
MTNFENHASAMDHIVATTRVKTLRLMQYWWKQDWTMFCCHIVHSCQQYWTMLLHPIQAQHYCSMLLTSVNNVGSKTLFNPARRFLPCILFWAQNNPSLILTCRLNVRQTNQKALSVFLEYSIQLNHAVRNLLPLLSFGKSASLGWQDLEAD